MGEGIGGQDIWGNSLTEEERWNHFKSGALGSGLSLLGGGAAAGKLGALSQPTLATVATYGTFSDGQDIGAAISGRDMEGNSLNLLERLKRGGMGLLGALDLASPGGKYPLTPDSGGVGIKGNDSLTIPLIPPKLQGEVTLPSVIHPPNNHTEGLNLPLIPGQKTGDSSDLIPFIPPHGQSSVTPPSLIHPPNRSGETTTHPHHPEIEPGVVAKEKTDDGHEIKVLKDGRVVRCSDCGEIRIQYENILEQRVDLKLRFAAIEGLSNPQQKAAQAQEFAQELASIQQNKIIDPKTGKPFEVDSEQKLLDHQGRILDRNFDFKKLSNEDLKVYAQRGDRAALDELNYRKLVYQKHLEVQREQPIYHQGSERDRGLGSFPPPTPKTVEASRQIMAFLEQAALNAEEVRLPNEPIIMVPPTKTGTANEKRSFAVNVTQVEEGNGQTKFIVSLSGSLQTVSRRLEILRRLPQQLSSDFELGSAYVENYNPQIPVNFPGGRDCAEPKSFFQRENRQVKGVITFWFGRRNMGFHEIPDLLNADPSRRHADVGSHGMYMLPCPSCELNSAAMLSGKAYQIPTSDTGETHR